MAAAGAYGIVTGTTIIEINGRAFFGFRCGFLKPGGAGGAVALRAVGRALVSSTALLPFEYLVTGHDIQEFLGDGHLALAVELEVDLLQAFLDILLGVLHGSKPAGVLAGQ